MDRVKYYSRFEDEIQKVVFQRPGTQGKKAGVSIDRALPWNRCSHLVNQRPPWLLDGGGDISVTNSKVIIEWRRIAKDYG